MYRIVYEDNRAVIERNVSPAGFHALWDTWIVAYSAGDIPENFWMLLSDEDQEILAWFFEDLRNVQNVS